MSNPTADPAVAASSILPAGAAAPDFELPAGPDRTVSLRQFRGRPVILAFYPADWSPVCGDQLALYNEVLDEFQEHNAQLLGVSVDGMWCHRAYADARRMKFPLLSDFEPKGAVSRRYGVYDDAWGTSRRALFVIDADGVIRWSYLSPVDVNPGADGILAALEELGAPSR
jgi:peroxiredoxin